MNTGKNITLNQNTLRVLWLRYKEYSIPLLVIVVCFMLFYFVILYQIQDIMQTRQKEEETRQRINKLSTNFTFLESLPTDTVYSQLQLLSAALPPEKDFAGILNAISQSASVTGVTLGDFGLVVGDLSTQSAQLATVNQPSLGVDLRVDGSIDRVNNFITRLNEEFPLSEVAGVSLNNSSANIKTIFYFRPIPYVGFNKLTPLRPLTKEELTIVNQLDAWRTGAVSLPSTSSATVIP